MLGRGGYGDLLASIRLEDRPEVVLGRALARGRSLEEAIGEAKLRVEAIDLIPRVVQFAKEARVPAATFDALEGILKGAGAQSIVEKMFAG
jgi:glycerol-3-phosphate dehydrogenase (NAD(P)+)